MLRDAPIEPEVFAKIEEKSFRQEDLAVFDIHHYTVNIDEQFKLLSLVPGGDCCL